MVLFSYKDLCYCVLMFMYSYIFMQWFKALCKVMQDVCNMQLFTTNKQISPTEFVFWFYLNCFIFYWVWLLYAYNINLLQLCWTGAFFLIIKIDTHIYQRTHNQMGSNSNCLICDTRIYDNLPFVDSHLGVWKNAE